MAQSPLETGKKDRTSISIDEGILSRARATAERHGLSLSEWLERQVAHALMADASGQLERESMPAFRAVVEHSEERLEKRMLSLERRVMGVAGYMLWHVILAHYLAAKAVEVALDDGAMKPYYDKVQDAAEALVQRILTELDSKGQLLT